MIKQRYLVLVYMDGQELVQITTTPTANYAYKVAREQMRTYGFSAFCFSLDKPKARPWEMQLGGLGTQPSVRQLFRDRDACLRHMWLNNAEC